MARLVVLGMLLAGAAPALAAGPSAGRYTFVPVAGGALRLDTRTGEVSLCIGGERAPVCTRVAENIRLTVSDRTLLAELERRVAAVEARQQADGLPIGRVKMLARRVLDHFVGAGQTLREDIEG